VVGPVPVADEGGVVGGRRREGDGDLRAAEDADAAEAAGGLVEGERGEVVVGADLVLGLHDVGEVGARRDRARRAGHAVLERVPPLLEPAPASSHASIWLSETNTGTGSIGRLLIDRSITAALAGKFFFSKIRRGLLVRRLPLRMHPARRVVSPSRVDATATRPHAATHLHYTVGTYPTCRNSRASHSSS